MINFEFLFRCSLLCMACYCSRAICLVGSTKPLNFTETQNVFRFFTNALRPLALMHDAQAHCQYSNDHECAVLMLHWHRGTVFKTVK